MEEISNWQERQWEGKTGGLPNSYLMITSMRPWDLEVLPQKMKTRSKLCSTFQGPTVHFSGEKGMGQNPPTFHACTWPLGHKRLVTKKLYAFEHMEFSGGLSFVYNIISPTLGMHNTGSQMFWPPPFSSLSSRTPPAHTHMHTHIFIWVRKEQPRVPRPWISPPPPPPL